MRAIPQLVSAPLNPIPIAPMSRKLKHQLTSATRTADWPGQEDQVKVKHNAIKGWGVALFFIGSEENHAVELPFLTYSCISAFNILLCATSFGSTSTVTWYLLHRLQGGEEIILLFILFDSSISSSCESVCATAGSSAEQLNLLAWKASGRSRKLPGYDVNSSWKVVFCDLLEKAKDCSSKTLFFLNIIALRQNHIYWNSASENCTPFSTFLWWRLVVFCHILCTFQIL